MSLTNGPGLIDTTTEPKTIVQLFWASLYFSTITWTTLGYGDIVPSKELRVIAASEAITGWIAMAISITVLLNTFKSTTTSTATEAR
jgi:hypothetical protein